MSGRWLHLEKKSDLLIIIISFMYTPSLSLDHYYRTKFDPDAEGLAGLQWDSAELFQVYRVLLYSYILFSITFS